MAPRDTKTIPRVQQRPITKTSTSKKPAISTSCIKKAMASTNNAVEKTPLKAKSTTETRKRTSTAPVAATPKAKDNKPVAPTTMTRSAKKAWMRRPKPAHSGVPVPEKMKKLLGKRFQESDCSF